MTKTEKKLSSKGIRPTEMRLKIYKYLKRKTYAVSLNEMQKVFINKNIKTANKTTQGTGSPHAKLEERTRQELYNRAKELQISGRSNMTKSQLVKAIRERG